MTATLIQCTDSKRTEEAPARNLYDESAYFRRMKAWAQARGDPWFVLSAKHGLLAPDTVVSPYNQRGLSVEQAEEIASELADRGHDVVHVTAGRDYTDPLIPALESRGVDVVNHFAGERIGTRRKLLKRATAELRNESLC